MMISEDSRTDCLIVGAGALGLQLAAAFKKSIQNQKTHQQIAVLNRRLLTGQVTVHLPDGELVDLTGNIQTNVPLWFTHSSSQRMVFFCLPPESTEKASLTFLTNIQSICGTLRNITFVFCNNGCLPDSLLRVLQTEGAVALRALFFVGAIRQENSQCSVVNWTGGNRVNWNILLPDRNAPVEHFERVLKQLSFELSSGELFVDWRRATDIVAIERSKFFTNFMLAAGIGRRNEKNKSLYTRLNSGTLDMTASQCARLWKIHGVNEHDLKSMLSSTVSATGENINSLSLAAVNGNDNTMRWFLDFLKLEISTSKDFRELQALYEFAENVRVEWGIGNE